MLRSISVVIPTLNEEQELPRTLQLLKTVPQVAEIIVSDAGSRDATRSIAAAAGAAVLTGARGRGAQLRLGAHQATGDVILLLHADTWVQPDLGSAILRTFQNPRVVGGACLKDFRDPHWLMRGSRWRCRYRMAALQFAYGDQALFIPRTILDAIGGVPEVPLMEEYLLCQSLRNIGRLALAETTVTTSARRFRERGVVRTYWRMAMVNLRWTLGATPQALAGYYSSSAKP